MGDKSTVCKTETSCDWRRDLLGVNEKLKYIMDNGLFTDVSFKVGEVNAEVIEAQSFVLIMFSKVFEAMFGGNFKEARGFKEHVEVPDIQPSAFRNMLKFLSEGHLVGTLDVSDLIYVLYAAKKYEITELEKECVRLFKANISEENAVTVLQTAQLFNEKELEMEAFYFIRWNFESVMEGEDFLNISRENLCSFVKDEDTIAFELNVFKGVLRWGISQCRKVSIPATPENQRKMMEEALRFVRLPLISSEDFAMDVLPAEVLTKGEIIHLSQHRLVPTGRRSLLPSLPFKSIRRNIYTVKMPSNQLNRDIGRTRIGECEWSNLFMADRSIYLTTFGFGGPLQLEFASYNIRFKIFSTTSYKPLREGNYDGVSIRKGEYFHVRIPRPLLMDPLTNYKASFILKGPRTIHNTVYSDGELITQAVPTSNCNVNFTWTEARQIMPEIGFHI